MSLVPHSRVVLLSVQLGLLLAGLLGPAPAHPQALGPGEVRALQGSIAKSIEAMVILGGDNGINGGKFKFDSNLNTDLRIVKAGGYGPVTEPKAMGSKGMEWAPLLVLNGGYLKSDHTITFSALAGNEAETKTYAGELGAGARFKLLPFLSVAPKLSLIYGRTKHEFTARTQEGVDLESFLGGQLVDWTVNSMTIAPAFDVKLDWEIGRVGFEFISDYRFFQIWSFGESSPVVSLGGTSQTWMNSIDMNVPLGWKLLGHELNVGTSYKGWALFGDIEEALESGYTQAIDARIALDIPGKLLWHTSLVGVGGRYFWSGNSTGWGIGMDIRMAF
jgi:hypothetical protein